MSELNYTLDLYREDEVRIPKLKKVDTKYVKTKAIKEKPITTKVEPFCKVKPTIVERIDGELHSFATKNPIEVISAIKVGNNKTIIFKAEGLLWRCNFTEALKTTEPVPAHVDKNKIMNNILGMLTNIKFIDL